MSIENRALTSCKARLLKAEADYCLSNGNERTKSKKYQQVRLFKFIYEAVQYYINRPEWIPITVSPPEVDADILITVATGQVYSGQLRANGTYTADIFPDGCDQVNAIAWMPFPDGYNPQKRDGGGK